MKEQQVRQIVRKELLGEGRNYDHTSNLDVVRNVSLSDLEPGQFARISYAPKQGEERYREIFVVDPNYQGKLHALDISYMSEEDIARFFAEIHARLSPMAREMLSKTFPRVYTTGPIDKDENFYQNVIKNVPAAKGSYRTYRLDRVNNDLIQLVKYRPSLGGELQDYRGVSEAAAIRTQVRESLGITNFQTAL